MKATALSVCLTALLSAPALAQTFEVPGDYADLQEALDAVPANATIVVHDGDWYQLTITKPVRIVGDPAPRIWGEGDGPVNESPITLDGPGSGDVILSNVEVGMFAYAPAFWVSEPGIRGGGFDALYIYDSIITGPEWYFVYSFLFGGADAINTELRLLWCERSTIRGAATQADPVNLHSVGADAGSAIVTTGMAVVLDCTVRGGNGDLIFHENGDCGGTCPGGDGGDGVVARQLVHRGSTFVAGIGSEWRDPSNSFCCAGADGVPMLVDSVIALPPLLLPR